MKYEVIYELKNGTLRHQTYTDSKEAFERFWKLGHNGQNPMLTNDNTMGGFSFRDIQGFRSRPEGKWYAYKAFMEYMKEYKK